MESASSGGASGQGIVYKVDSAGNETILYSFTAGNDGGQPSATVTLDQLGNIYGTTAFGGAAGLGVVFKLTPAGQEAVLRTLARGPDGDQPDQAGVTLDSLGNLYGTTALGGAGGAGAVYKLDIRANWTVLYAFPGTAGGQYPYNNDVTLESDGKLYGSTFCGGSNGKGVVYRMDGRDERVLYTFDLLSANGFWSSGRRCDS